MITISPKIGVTVGLFIREKPPTAGRVCYATHSGDEPEETICDCEPRDVGGLGLEILGRWNLDCVGVRDAFVVYVSCYLPTSCTLYGCTLCAFGYLSEAIHICMYT